MLAHGERPDTKKPGGSRGEDAAGQMRETLRL
jgi:hypothetical protein